MKQELKSGIPEFDNAVEQFENGEINFLELTCLLWSTAYAMGKSEQLNLPHVISMVCPKCKSDVITEYPYYKECRICGNVW